MSVKIAKEVLKSGEVRWRARGVTVGQWPNGQRRRVTVTARTKRRAEAA